MLEKDFLIKEYINNQKSMGQIAKENDVSNGTVYNYIKKYNIKSRRHLTDEAKRKISSKNKGRPSPNKGKTLSKEVKEKISKSHKGKFRKKTHFGGHRKQRKDGYICVYIPNHKYANKDGYVP